MNRTRIIFTILFWILFSIIFELLSDAVFGTISLEIQVFVWFFFLVAGTLIINGMWYWLALRRR